MTRIAKQPEQVSVPADLLEAAREVVAVGARLDRYWEEPDFRPGSCDVYSKLSRLEREARERLRCALLLAEPSVLIER